MILLPNILSYYHKLQGKRRVNGAKPSVSANLWLKWRLGQLYIGVSVDQAAVEAIEMTADEAVVLAAIETVDDLHPLAKIRAKVKGEAILELPQDLYIPPDALEIFLEAFEGPLDLLLYLIKRHNLDILDIPIADITRQYMEYVEIMKHLHLELAAEYLVMAASLAEIKSRMLLPRVHEEEAEEHDPRADLVRRLQEYERFKNAAESLDELPREGRDTFISQAEPPSMEKIKPLPQVQLQELLMAMQAVMRRVSLNASHQVEREALSVRERMSGILDRLQTRPFMDFEQLFTRDEGRMGVVVSFIAVLELLRQSLIEIVQQAPYQPIHVKACMIAADQELTIEETELAVE